MMNIETKAVADVACERFVYSNSDALANFLELYDDQKRAVKHLAKLIKGFYEYDMRYALCRKCKPRYCSIYFACCIKAC